MARYQVILSYDGTEFHGFQRQGEKRTVQLEVENALRRLGWQEKSILTAGRTDTGVHAAAQVIGFDLEWSHSMETLGKALNAFLPKDVSVREVCEARVDFHPRFDALSRCYHYQVYFQPQRDAIRDRYAWQIWPSLDCKALQAAAKSFIGTHDFAAFGSPMKPGGNTVRTVLFSEWNQAADRWVYQIRANAFLYRMVRRIVFLQSQVASGRLRLDALEDGIYNQKPMPPGIAPARGLTLEEVLFEEK